MKPVVEISVEKLALKQYGDQRAAKVYNIKFKLELIYHYLKTILCQT